MGAVSRGGEAERFFESLPKEAQTDQVKRVFELYEEGLFFLKTGKDDEEIPMSAVYFMRVPRRIREIVAAKAQEVAQFYRDLDDKEAAGKIPKMPTTVPEQDEWVKKYDHPCACNELAIDVLQHLIVDRDPIDLQTRAKDPIYDTDKAVFNIAIEELGQALVENVD